MNTNLLTKLLVIVSLSWAVTTNAQIYPVVFDADDRPIGNLVDMQTQGNSRYAVMISLKGYLAAMAYTTSLSRTGETDVPGLRTGRIYETDDCVGDPVITVLSLAFPSNSTSLETTGFFGYFASKELMEIDGNVYYFPADAVGKRIDNIKSIFYGICQNVDRCNEQDQKAYPQFMNWPSSSDPNLWCPDFVPPSPGSYQYPVMSTGGPRLSSLKLNDPAITGFQSIAYKRPFSIRYVDINTILQDGFEAQTK